MSAQQFPEFLDHGQARLAYHHTEGAGRGLVFLGGFKSDMTGSKALALEAWARATGRPFTRFDYQGHGQSSGRFVDGTIGQWIDDAVAILDRVTAGSQVLIGSSMGAWVMLQVALRRPERVGALVGLASAPDFTEDLIWARLDQSERHRLESDGVLAQPNAYDDDPYPVTLALIREARRHLLLRGPIPLTAPIRLIHGMADADVPWETSTRLAACLDSADVQVLLLKDAGHRLSRDEDIARIIAVVAELVGASGGTARP